MRRALAVLIVLSLVTVSCDDGEDELVVARWRLAEAADAGATQLTVEVLDPEWNCGVSVLGRMVRSEVVERDDSIELEIRLEPVFRNHVICDAPLEPERLVIDLEREVGDREVVGATTSWPSPTDE